MIEVGCAIWAAVNVDQVSLIYKYLSTTGNDSKAFFSDCKYIGRAFLSNIINIMFFNLRNNFINHRKL